MVLTFVVDQNTFRLRPQGDPHRVREGLRPPQDLLPRVRGEQHAFVSHGPSPAAWRVAGARLAPARLTLTTERSKAQAIRAVAGPPLACAAVMLRIVRPATGDAEGRGWVDVVDPTPAEIERLRDDYGIAEGLVVHALDPDERPRVERQERSTLVVLQVPHARRDRGAALPYVTLPFGIFLAGKWLVTVSPEETEVLERIRGFAAVDWPERKQHRFILHALEVVARTYLTHLAAINREVDAVEARLATSLENREVLELLRYQKALIYYGTALRGSERLLQQLQRSPAFDIPEEDADLLDVVAVEIRQAVDVATVSGNILGEMMDAFASIISNNLNVVMRFLAAVTVILAFPVIVASLYGMNVRLPVQEHPHAFAILVAVSLALAAGVTIWFLRRRWL